MAETAQRMSRVDTAWLRMDSPANLMMIVGVWLLQPALDGELLRERLESRLLGYGRFRQKVVRDATGCAWVEDADFELDRHVRTEPLRRRRGQSERAALQARAGALAAQPLDPAHPLWQIHFIPRYDGGSALIVRIHHCIADGIALVSVLMSLADGDAGPPPPTAATGATRAAPPGVAQWLADEVLQPFTEAAVQALGQGGEAAVAALQFLAHPGTAQSVGPWARGAAALVRDALALATLPDDDRTLLKGPLSGRKVVAWCEPIPLEQVKAVAKALGGSVNDVLLTCAVGSIGADLRERGDDPAGKDIRAMVPVNLRDPRDAWQLGNRFGLAPVLLPVGLANPVECFYAVRARMAALKDSRQPLLAYALLGVSGALPQPLQAALSDVFLHKTTAVMTNVPGPPQPIRFCGSTLRQSIFWVPSSGQVGVGVSIVSYAGGVQFGLVTDSARCPDPQTIIDRFAPEFEKLLLLTLMLPWARDAARLASP